jgi:hypothetical protein
MSRIRCGYCGGNRTLPSGYDYFEPANVCLRKGIGVGIHQERRKFQRQLGLRIDPPYVSPCPRIPGLRRRYSSSVGSSRPRRRNRYRSRSRSSSSRRRYRRSSSYSSSGY